MTDEFWVSREETLDNGRIRLWYTFADGSTLPTTINRDAMHPSTVQKIGEALAAEKHRLLPNVQRINPGD